MIVDGRHKLICDLESGGCSLYDRARDPGERRDAGDGAHDQQDRGNTPECEFAPHAAAIDDLIGIERHSGLRGKASVRNPKFARSRSIACGELRIPGTLASYNF